MKFLLRAGDLVRWRSPLWLVENGVEIDVGRPHNALILSIKTVKNSITKVEYTEVREIKLMLIGAGYCAQLIEMPIESFYEIGELEKIVEGKWVNISRL